MGICRAPRAVFVFALVIAASAAKTVSASAYPEGYRLPFEGKRRITCGPGCGVHNGSTTEAVDFQALDRSSFEILAIAQGIAYQKWHRALGNYLLIDHGAGRWSMNAHLERFLVANGAPVQGGQPVAMTGTTGTGGAGNHLHFEIRENVTGGNFFSGTTISIIDHPGVSYDPNGPRFQKGFAIREPKGILMTHIESFFYDPYYESTSSTATLLQGRNYIITITGTYSLWAPFMWGEWTGDGTTNTCEGKPEQQPMFLSPDRENGPTSHDAEYFYAYPRYTWYGENTCMTGDLRFGRSYSLMMSVDGGRSFSHVEPVGSAFNQSHEYQYRLVGQGHPLEVKRSDVLYTDNNGMLKIVIEAEQ